MPFIYIDELPLLSAGLGETLQLMTALSCGEWLSQDTCVTQPTQVLSNAYRAEWEDFAKGQVSQARVMNQRVQLHLLLQGSWRGRYITLGIGKPDNICCFQVGGQFRITEEIVTGLLCDLSTGSKKVLTTCI